MTHDREPGVRPLSRRDAIVMPLLALATVIGLALPAEIASRIAFPSVEADACNVTSDGGTRAKAYCVSRTKVAEGPWTTNRYNGCGYRTPEPCGPKPPGSLRVAVIGASTSAGYLTPYEESMAGRASRTLTGLCGRPVEFQNLGAMGAYGDKLVARTREAMALKPDAVVLVVAPIDFDLAARRGGRADRQPSRPKPLALAKDALAGSRLLYMEQYFLLKSDDSYVPVYLNYGAKADFMRTPLSPAWTRKLHDFDGLMAQLSALARHGRAPLVLLYAPQRAQAAMIASDRFGHDLDPGGLPQALAQIAQAHDIKFVDAGQSIPRDTPSANLFYAVNGHPNGRGHGLLAQALVRRMVQPDLPVFADACRRPSLAR